MVWMLTLSSTLDLMSYTATDNAGLSTEHAVEVSTARSKAWSDELEGWSWNFGVPSTPNLDLGLTENPNLITGVRLSDG